jgi:hypothetical protein
MNNYIMPHALSDIKSLHVTYYGWHDLPQDLWIINEYFKYIYMYYLKHEYTLKNRCAKQHTLVCYLAHKVC